MKLRDAIERIPEELDLPVFGALFLAALCLRLTALEGAPLSEREAADAWGAWHLLHGQASSSVSALFSSLTAGVLFIAGPSHWAPRLFPALAGALAVFLPLLFRSERGRLEAYLTAILLAFSPSLSIASTMAGGTTLGFLAAGTCILYLRSKEQRPLMAGAALGLAAASGPVGWSGLAIAAAAVLVDWILRISAVPASEPREAFPFRASFDSFLQSRVGTAGFLAGLIAGSTGMFVFPRGLGALAAGLADWVTAFLSGWPRIGESILLFIAYEPIALVFGGAGLFLLWKGRLSGEDRFWGMFAAVAAVWVLLRPAAFPDEALWITLPLLILGARVLRSALESPILEERPVFVAVQAAGVAALAAFAFFNLAGFHQTGLWTLLALAALGLSVSLVLGAVFTENWRQDWRKSLTGLALAWAAVFLVIQSGAGWNATHVRRASASELWQSEVVPEDIVRLHRALEWISESQTGVKDELAVLVLLPEESALGWELLTFGAVRYVTALDMLSTPAVLIIPYAEWEGVVDAPRLPAAYRGQGFAVAERRGWSGWPPDLIGWLLYREGPVERGSVILWVREDILVPEAGTGE